MAKHDEGAAGSPLAEALSAPLEAGSLEAALHAARTFFMRHPGDDDAKRVVEALELLMAQVWFGGAEEGEEPDARHAEAAHHLAAVDLERALACYDALAERGPRAESARRLALRVRTVLAARAGEPLPPPEKIAVPLTPVFQEETTRVAAAGELPLAAFNPDDVTASFAAIPNATHPNEPMRAWTPGAHARFDEPSDDEPTRIHAENELEAALHDEVTRVAGVGELPLEQLRGSDRDGGTESAAPVHEATSQAGAEPSPVLDSSIESAEEPRGEADSAAARASGRSALPKPPAGPVVPPPPVFVAEPPQAPAPTPVDVPRASDESRPESLAPEESAERVIRAPSMPKRAFKPIVKDGPRPSMSVPPPVVHAPEIIGRSSVVAPHAQEQPRSSSPLASPNPLHDAPAPVAPPRGPVLPPPPTIVAAASTPLDAAAAPMLAASSERDEPGDDDLDPAGDAIVELGEPSWAGVRVYGAPPATFEPEAAPVEADTWGEPTHAVCTSPEQVAEELVARGELGEALRIYQDLAASRPDEPQLWERVAEIARLLRQRAR